MPINKQTPAVKSNAPSARPIALLEILTEGSAVDLSPHRFDFRQHVFELAMAFSDLLYELANISRTTDGDTV